MPLFILGLWGAVFPAPLWLVFMASIQLSGFKAHNSSDGHPCYSETSGQGRGLLSLLLLAPETASGKSCKEQTPIKVKFQWMDGWINRDVEGYVDGMNK